MPKTSKQFITCEERIMRTGSYHFSSCGRRASVQRGDHWFCGTHDPVKRAERDEARQAKWDAEFKAKAEQWKREKLVGEICEGVETERLQQLGKGWVKLVLDAIEQAGYFGY